MSKKIVAIFIILLVALSLATIACAIDVSSEYYTTLNPFHQSGYGLPNCTCFAWGRAYEAFGTRPNLSTGNGDSFWSYNINNGCYPYGSDPMPGSIACWNGGNGGHVAFVESVSGDDVTISQSAWGWRGTDKIWEYQTVNRYNMSSIQAGFQGYIYLQDFEPQVPTVTADVSGCAVDLSWSNVWADSYYVYVYNQETGDVPWGENLGKAFSTHLYLSPGKYCFYVTAVYSSDVMKSGVTEAELMEEQAPTINAEVNGGDVLVTWSNVSAQSYYVYVDTPTSSDAIYGENLGKTFSAQFHFSEGCTFLIHVTAVFSDTLMKSDYIEVFTGEKPSAELATVPSARTGLVYTGLAQELVVSGASNDGTVQYAIGKDQETIPTEGWSEDVPKGTDVKTYYVWYKVAGNTSHRDSDAKCIEVKITPAIPRLTSVAFAKSSVVVKKNVSITAVTSTNATKLCLYSGSSLVKTWTTGYTDEGTERTWKVTYAFSGTGKRTVTFKTGNSDGMSDGLNASITVTAAPKLTSVKFAKTKATVKQNVTINAVTSTNVTKLNMYSGSTLAKSWTSGYTDEGTTRTWKVTYAFAGAGSRTLSFKALDASGNASTALKASITITKAPTLSSVKFSSSTVALKKNATIIAVTSTNATKLTMYNGSKAVKTWTAGYTDSGTTRTWKVTYAFRGSGKRTMSFKAFDANGAATAAKSATITVSSVPTLNSVEFGADSVVVKKNVKIIAMTSTSATKLTMYNGTKAVKTWTTGYTDNGSVRTWKVTYAFAGAGIRTMTFKAGNAAGMSAAKKAIIEVTK